MTGSSRRLPPLAWVGLCLLGQHRIAGRRRTGPWSATLAGAIAAASLGLLGWAVSGFRRHDTTVDPLEPARAAHLVTEGAFGVTRNPMYVAMTGVLVSHAVARRSLLAFLPAGAFAAFMDRTQIQVEESVMQAKFGADWDRYAANTPRWLSSAWTRR